MYLIGVIVIAAIAYFLYRELYGKREGLPPGPTPWPVVGNILQLDLKHPEKSLVQWGKQYGPVFTIWMPVPFVIVNDYDLMKESFLKQGDIFAGRPETFIMRQLAKGNFGLVFARDELWREQRRFALHVLRDFGVGRNMLEPKILDQARELISILHSTKGPTQLKPALTFAVGNVINVMIVGYAWKFGDQRMKEFQAIVDEFIAFVTKPTILLLELYPWIRFFEPPFNIGFKRLEKSNHRFQSFFSEEIRKHKETLDENEQPRDYTDAYLIEMNKRIKAGNQVPCRTPHAAKVENFQLLRRRKSLRHAVAACGGSSFSEWQLQVAMGDMWSAGMETTVTTLRFAFLYLLNYPNVLKKLHEEMDEMVGRERDLSMSDQKILPYLCATIHEVQRIANIVPINIQHTVTEDVVVGGYRIPKDTIVVAQTPSIHLDEKLFPDPYTFSPERHIDANGRFVKNEHILPFSIGKRACMGESLARMELFLFLGSLVQHCDFRPADGKTPPPIETVIGSVQSPAPYDCVIVPRT
uniref:Cytochrome P450 n=1 Tax=Plectus sambesii TaxID=2011161 RepID=A0A914X7R8_9BILA